MVRQNDPFWDFVDKLYDGSFKCTFCGYKFAAATSISRIKWHLSGVKGRGVKICGKAPEDIQDAVRAAIDSPPENKYKAIASSSNYDVANTISTSAREQNYERRHVEMAQQGEQIFTGEHAWANDLIGEGTEIVPNAPETRPMSEQASQEMELTWERNSPEELPHDAFGTIPRTEQAQHLERGSSHARPSIGHANEPRGDSSPPPDLLCLGHGRYYDQLCSPLVNNVVIMDDVQNMVREKTIEEDEELENNSGRLVQPGAGASSSGFLKYNPNETRGDPLPTSSTKVVGQAFEENTNVIWSSLMDDEVSTIGIYGMGGVGKTTMLQHIHNELLQRRGIYHDVYWVTVSRDFNISRLQNLIAKCLCLDLSREDDDLRRAIKLSKELRKKQKWILILDDLWNHFELHRVGIPVPLKGCKLIVTTRSESVCLRRHSQLKIKVKPLSEREAWTLFMENLGHDTALCPEVERIAEDVARECAGLPLGIVTVAGSLRGVDDLHEWRNTLNKLKESKFRDMKDEVFRLLRFSYDQLDDLAIQQCLLYCALFPEDHKIEREELIGYLIDEGIIEGTRSRQAAFDEGHTMLNRLENVSLLESAKMFIDLKCVKMHDLIRDMAIQIQQENTPVIVKAGAQIKELPDTEEWIDNLTRVSLMHNQITEIPSSHSPKCPSLSTLLLCHNRELGFIADSFFDQLHGLKVLDLSHTRIEKLSASVSDLVSLTALLLHGCEKLRNVPSLKNLRALKRLDLYWTALEKMPQGMECLTNLRYFRMGGCSEKEFPSGILPKLSHLQVFVLEESKNSASKSVYVPVTVKGKEVGCLRKVEILECHFECLFDLAEFLKSQDEIQSLRKYKIFVGLFDENDYFEMRGISTRSKTIGLGNLSINRDVDFQVMFPKDIQQLTIVNCNDATSLCDVSSVIKYAKELEVIQIRKCNNIESLVSSSWLCSAPLPLPSYNRIFPVLKEFHCYKCTSIKKLFPLVLLPHLVNLEVIHVEDCEKMEEIIETRSYEEGVTDEESSSNTDFSLLKLRSLVLHDLPELRSIFSEKVICDSLKTIWIENCQKLRCTPISLSSLENCQLSPRKRIYMNPKDWWETFLTERPSEKDMQSGIVDLW